jgi:hypothetical protein
MSETYFWERGAKALLFNRASDPPHAQAGLCTVKLLLFPLAVHFWNSMIFCCRGVIRLGEHNTNTDPDCEDDVCADPHQDYFPTEVIVHEDYGKPLFKNDISLIRLDRHVVFSSKARLDVAQCVSTVVPCHWFLVPVSAGYVMPICVVHGTLVTKSYVGESSEVAGWGVYDIGTG